MPIPKKISGFNLIELLITVLIVGILASIAYPNYINSIRRSRATDAKAVLMQASQWMERFATINNRYDINLAGTDVETVFENSGLNQAPIEGQPKYYAITIFNVTTNTFELRATPITNNGQEKYECQTFTLTNTGVKGVTDGAPEDFADMCWR